MSVVRPGESRTILVCQPLSSAGQHRTSIIRVAVSPRISLQKRCTLVALTAICVYGPLLLPNCFQSKGDICICHGAGNALHRDPLLLQQLQDPVCIANSAWSFLGVLFVLKCAGSSGLNVAYSRKLQVFLVQAMPVYASHFPDRMVCSARYVYLFWFVFVLWWLSYGLAIYSCWHSQDIVLSSRNCDRCTCIDQDVYNTAYKYSFRPPPPLDLFCIANIFVFVAYCQYVWSARKSHAPYSQLPPPHISMLDLLVSSAFFCSCSVCSNLFLSFHIAQHTLFDASACMERRWSWHWQAIAIECTNRCLLPRLWATRGLFQRSHHIIVNTWHVQWQWWWFWKYYQKVLFGSNKLFCFQLQLELEMFRWEITKTFVFWKKMELFLEPLHTFGGFAKTGRVVEEQREASCLVCPKSNREASCCQGLPLEGSIQFAT